MIDIKSRFLILLLIIVTKKITYLVYKGYFASAQYDNCNLGANLNRGFYNLLGLSLYGNAINNDNNRIVYENSCVTGFITCC